MKRKNIVLLLLIFITICGLTFIAYKKFFYKEKEAPYTTQKPERRTIKKIIDASGKVSVAEKIKIGSLVTGTLKKLL